MFFHMLLYRIKAIYRQKQTFFWTFIFPLVLSTCFYLAFADINEKSEQLHTIPVAIVYENNDYEISFRSMMDSLSAKENGEEPLLAPVSVTEEEAIKMLQDKEVTGVIHLKAGVPLLTVAGNGIEETVIKTVLDRYIETVDILSTAKVSPELFQTLVGDSLSGSGYIEHGKLTDGTMDNMTDYFYALIGMVCMFGAFSGQLISQQMKANQSVVGMRKTLSSANRLTMMIADVLGSFLFQFLACLLLLVYLKYVLTLNLGITLLEGMIVCAVGSMVGISNGVLFGAIPKLSDNAKIGINITFSLVSSFLSGLMMGGSIKIILEKYCPFMNRINPSTLISNALYSLNIYDTYTKFYQNIFSLLAIAVILCVISFFITRREQYDSL